MNHKKSVLGRGLGAILRNPKTDITSENHDEENIVGNISKINISDIVSNPFQPRQKFNEEELDNLARSIKQLGVIQPITVRKLGNNKYQLISGERRLEASKIAQENKIPAFIRIANDQQMLEMALVENIQRVDLNPIEIALSYERLIKECKLTQEECSIRIGKKRSTIANFLGLLKLPEEIQVALRDKLISMGIAKSLIGIKDLESQLNIFHDAISYGFSVREVEEIVKEFKGKSYKKIPRKKYNQQTTLKFSLQQILHDLRKYLNKEIEIKTRKDGNGKIIIPFKSEEELDQIMCDIKRKM